VNKPLKPPASLDEDNPSLVGNYQRLLSQRMPGKGREHQGSPGYVAGCGWWWAERFAGPLSEPLGENGTYFRRLPMGSKWQITQSHIHRGRNESSDFA